MKSASIPSKPPPFRLIDERWRIGLLTCALLVNLFPLYRFIGSMIWFHQYLGDYQVFWGITQIPTGTIYDHRVFAYPPSTMLLLSPFGFLPFWPSLVAWSAVGVAAIAATAKRIMEPRAIALGCLTYAGVGTIVGGQISFFVGALIIAALGAPQPARRGALLAVAALIKPQSVIAAPIALIAERNWKAIAWAMGTGGILVLLSMLLLGPVLWWQWLIELPHFHAYLVSRGTDQMDVGVYGLARSLGLPGWSFLFAAPLGAATSWLVFRGNAPMLDRYAAFAACNVLLSPYTLYYDLAGLTFACVMLLLDRERSPLLWLAAALIVSSIFANLGIVLLAATLGFEAAVRSNKLGFASPPIVEREPSSRA